MTDPRAPDEVVAVVGQEVLLEFETDGPVDGSVAITFTVSTIDGPPGDTTRQVVPQARFQRSVSVEGTETVQGVTRSKARWKVELPDLPDLPRRLCIITFEAKGTGKGGRSVTGRSLNRLRVPGIAITDVAILKQMMLHEFARQNGSVVELDTNALERVLAELTVEQRKLLATHELAGRPGRLVVFITLRPGTDRLMFADNCSGSPVSIHANASMSVFACRGPGEVVTLVTHTNHFVVNTANGPTKSLLKSPQAGKPPNQWLSPANPSPPKFVVASHAAAFTDGVIWSRLFTSRGVDVMPGNSIHGMINTIGCWMIFRNYNWPVQLRSQLFRVYARSVRTGRSRAATEHALAALGYDLPDTGPASPMIGSFDKFLSCDLNYAYNLFFRYVVGVQWFAERSTYYGRFANVHNTHGLALEKGLLRSELLQERFLYHDVGTRSKLDGRTFAPPDSLFTENALGFRTADGFLPDAAWKQNLSGAALPSRTWGDWYFFKQEGVAIDDVIEPPMGPVP